MFSIDYLNNILHKNNKNKLLFNQNRIGFEYTIDYDGEVYLIPFFDLGLSIESTLDNSKELIVYNDNTDISNILNDEYESSMNNLNKSQLNDLRNEIISIDKSVFKCCLSQINTFEQVAILSNNCDMVTDFRKYCSFKMDVTLCIGGNLKNFNINLNNKKQLEVIEDIKFILSYKKLEKYKNKINDIFFDSGTFGLIIHEIIGHIFEEDFYLQNKKFDIEKQFKSNYTVIEGRNKNVFLKDYNKFDDNGTAFFDKAILLNGKFNSLITQKRRENYRHPAITRMNCTYLNTGKHDRDDILHNIKDGILVKNIIGGYIEPDSYRVFLFINEAYKIKNGNLCGMFEDFMIQTDVYKILDNEAFICNNLIFTEGTCIKNNQRVNLYYGAPSVLIQNLYL